MVRRHSPAVRQSWCGCRQRPVKLSVFGQWPGLRTLVFSVSGQPWMAPTMRSAMVRRPARSQAPPITTRTTATMAATTAATNWYSAGQNFKASSSGAMTLLGRGCWAGLVRLVEVGDVEAADAELVQLGVGHLVGRGGHDRAGQAQEHLDPLGLADEQRLVGLVVDAEAAVAGRPHQADPRRGELVAVDDVAVGTAAGGDRRAGGVKAGGVKADQDREVFAAEVLVKELLALGVIVVGEHGQAVALARRHRAVGETDLVGPQQVDLGGVVDAHGDRRAGGGPLAVAP